MPHRQPCAPPSFLPPDVIPASRRHIPASRRHPCVPTSSLRPDVIPASRRHPCLPPSSLRKQGSRKSNVFSHLDPRVREDDGKKIQLVLLGRTHSQGWRFWPKFILLGQTRRRESGKTNSNLRATVLPRKRTLIPTKNES